MSMEDVMRLVHQVNHQRDASSAEAAAVEEAKLEPLPSSPTE